MQKNPQGSFLKTMANLIFSNPRSDLLLWFSSHVSACLFQLLRFSFPVSACHICSTNHITYSQERRMLVIGTSDKIWVRTLSLFFYLSSFKKSVPFILLLLLKWTLCYLDIRSLVSVKSASNKTRSFITSRHISFTFRSHFASCRCGWRVSWYSFNPVRMTFQSQVNTQHSCTL